jgi:ABC-2 type transport system ATP-binding protein
VTIFLTSHVMEIVERLCSHVAIINKGRLVAQGSIEDLRAGVPGDEGGKITLEQIFLSIVGQHGGQRAAEPQLDELSWLT